MLELEPKSPAARECLFRAYIAKNDHVSAVRVMRERMILWNAKPESLKRMDGDAKQAIETELRETYADIRASAAKGDKIWTMYGAWLAARFGDKDQAFEWLDRAVKERASFVLFFDIDPMWDSLRSDPRFTRLKEQIRSF
jgi:hypothetical protein